MLPKDLLNKRTNSQRLCADACADSVEDGVASVIGLQAQEARAAALGVRVRTEGHSLSDVRDALYVRRAVVRTWCMRGTLHLVAATDVRWLLSIFGPVFVRRSRRRLAQLGLDDADSDRAMDVMRDALSNRPMTRSELATAVLDVGIPLDLDSQAPYHLLRRAALLGILCEWDPNGADPRYALLDDLVPEGQPADRTTVLARLARRYLIGYGPASIEDFASWTKLPMRDVRSGWSSLQDDADVTPVDDRRLLSVREDKSTSDVSGAGHAPRLLPAYDDYVLGYESVLHALEKAEAPHVQPGGGVVRPAVVVGGRIVGTWKIDAGADKTRISARLFGQADHLKEEHVQEEAEDVARFLGGALEHLEVERVS